MNVLVRSSAAAALSLALAAPASAVGQVYVVDDVAGPGVDFTSLETALLVAQGGDVVLLRSGTYTATAGANPKFFVSTSVTVIADESADVVLASPVHVSGLPLGTRVSLRGLRIQVHDVGTALLLFDNAGTVWVEDCAVSSTATSPLASPGHGAQAIDSDSVVFARCILTGSGTAIGGFHGLHSQTSSVCLYDCRLRGGNGGSGSSPFPFGGGDGVYLLGGFVFASGTAFQGGDGGKGADETPSLPCSNGMPGGNGARLFALAPNLTALDCTFSPGVGGPAGDSSSGPSCSSGSDGLPVLVQSGTHVVLPGPARHLTVTAPVREGGTLTRTYAGPSGELVFTMHSGFSGSAYFEPFGGVLALATFTPFVTAFEGVVPAGGTLVKSFAVVPLLPGTEGATVYLQAAFLDPAATIHLGAPSATVLLDSTL